MTEFTKQQREAARARCEAATEGPWTLEIQEDRYGEEDDLGNPTGQLEYGLIVIPEIDKAMFDSEWSDEENWERDLANADFIRHARTDLPAALSALDAMEGRVKELEHLVRQITTGDAHEALAAVTLERDGLRAEGRLLRDAQLRCMNCAEKTCYLRGCSEEPDAPLVAAEISRVAGLEVSKAALEDRVASLDRISTAAWNHIHGDCGDCRELNDAIGADCLALDALTTGGGGE